MNFVISTSNNTNHSSARNPKFYSQLTVNHNDNHSKLAEQIWSTIKKKEKKKDYFKDN